MRRRAAGRRDVAAVIAGLLLLHASCQLQTAGTADESRTDASAAGSSGAGGNSDAGPDVDVPDVSMEPDADAASDAATADGGGDAGDSAVACGVNPEPLGGATCPAQCNGGCADNRCRILCVTGLPCKKLRCPEGFDCEVTCAGVMPCVELEVQCDPRHRCGVICDGVNSCLRAKVQCGSGSCGMLCTGAACTDATLNCGSGECFGLCPGLQPYPVVNCYDSCGCTPC